MANVIRPSYRTPKGFAQIARAAEEIATYAARKGIVPGARVAHDLSGEVFTVSSVEGGKVVVTQAVTRSGKTTKRVLDFSPYALTPIAAGQEKT